MSSILGVDVGEQRVGLAIARDGLRLATPLATLERTPDFWDQLLQLIRQNDVETLVVGLPRGMDGQETAQTTKTQAFGKELAAKTNLPIAWQDEAVTSLNAEASLKASGKPYTKGDIDAQAAVLILTDYLETRKVVG